MLYKPYTQLSKKVRCVQKNRQFTVISLPQGMEVTEIGGFSVTQKTPTVAILDEFYKKNQKLASGVKSSHGDIVTKYVVNGLEDQIGVLACNAISDIFTNHSGSSFPAKHAGYGVMHALEFLVKVQKKYHNIIAVNMSVEYGMVPDYIGPMTSITPKNKGRLLERLEYLADKYKDDILFNNSYKSILSINELIELGVEVYIGTGNSNDKCFNALNFSNAHAVSSCDTKYDNEQLSTAEAKGSHRFRKRFNIFGKLRYITDGIIKFYPDEIKTRKWIGLFDILLPWRTIHGTSYACPNVLNKYLRARLSQKTDHPEWETVSSDRAISTEGE